MPPAGYPAFLQYLQSGRVRNIDVAVQPVNVNKTDDGDLIYEGIRKDIDTKGQIVLKPNDWVAIFVKNSGREPVYVTVLDLGTDGSIKPVFPPENAPSIEEYTPARIDADNTYRRLPGVVVQLVAPEGQELFKVIATRQPADFGGFLYIPKGVDAKGDKFKKIPLKYQPLGLLMDNVMVGRKGNPMSEGIEWCTAEGVVEVRKP